MTDKSKCCNAPVTITGGMPEDDDRGRTLYFVCTKCDEPCDIVQQGKLEPKAYDLPLNDVCRKCVTKIWTDERAKTLKESGADTWREALAMHNKPKA